MSEPSEPQAGGEAPVAEPPVAPSADPPEASPAPTEAPSRWKVQQERATVWYERNERWLAPTAFIAGFTWDSLTLTRVDKVSDNAILALYLTALGALMVLDHRVGLRPEAWPRLAPHRGFMGWLTQFLFGGLYSAYVVFYFRSATFGPTFLFLAVLAGLMVANELFIPTKVVDRLRLSLYTLCAFSFLLFFIPVVTGYLGVGVFTMAAIGGLGLTLLLAWLMERGEPVEPREVMLRHLKSSGGLLAVLYLLDFIGLIPPVPLALMHRGIFHEVSTSAEGYVLRYERVPWKPWRTDDRVFHQRAGEKAWCFTAIFAPTGTALTITHVWEHRDEQTGEWVSTDSIPFSVRGGRDGGFRGYTHKRSLSPGDWRVRVVASNGRTLGTVPFVIEEPGEEAPEWAERTYK